MDLLRLHDFRALLITRLLDALGGRALDVVIGYELYVRTHDPLALGLLGLIEAIPALGLALFGGYLADRLDRRRILLARGIGSVLFAIGLAIGLHVTKGVFPIYALAFVVGVLRGLSSASAEAFGAQVMPSDRIVQASSLSSGLWQGGAIAGAALGGVVLAKFGATGTCVVSAVLSACAFWALLSVPSRPLIVRHETESIGESLRAGIKFVFASEYLVGSMALDLFAVLFGGAVALLPVFANDILKVGPEGFGILNAAPSVGAMLAMGMALRFPPKKHAGRDLILCVAGFGVTMIVFALSKLFWLSFVAMALSGAFDGISVVVRRAIMRQYSPEAMRGRIAAVGNIFVGASNELGALESGVTARLFGTAASVLYGGLLTLVVVGVTAWKLPRLRALDLSNPE